MESLFVSPVRRPSRGPLRGVGRGQRPASPPPGSTVTLWVGVRAVPTAVGSSGLGSSPGSHPPKWFSSCLLFGSPALGISYTAPHPSGRPAVFPSFEVGLWTVPWVSLGWASPAPGHTSRGPSACAYPGGRGRATTAGRLAGPPLPLPGALPPGSGLPHWLLHLRAPGQWPRGEPRHCGWRASVTAPAVSRLRSGEGALSILPEPRGGLGGQVCSAPVGGGAARVERQACSALCLG